MTITMRVASLPLLCLAFVGQAAFGQLKPEMVRNATLAEPRPSWFLVKADEGSYIFDGDTGQMQGLISHNFYTTGVVTLLSRQEAYHVESWYTKHVRGERNDVVTITDMTDLSPKAEIDIPDKAGALNFRHHIGMLGDERHLVVFNMTPAQSVSIVDVIDRQFDGEISTPGCAIIMPTGDRSFLMICGDGRLQLITLDENGREASRSRTEPFFVVEEDPVYDRPVLTDKGWLLVSHGGQAYDVSVSGSRVTVSRPWSLLGDEDREEEWRPGGAQPFAVHRNSTLLYVLMHQGKVDTHHEPGTEIWVFDTERKKRVGKLSLEVAASHLLSSQEEEPKLYVFDQDGKLGIYDGHQLKLIRSIDDPGPGPGLLQLLARDD
ncbi:MAG: hypothetical protein OEW35_09085 [Gammaproteobacteria bacterium]|nr:hypothetical protein [Gammaproteobacteria bacterium]MDH4253617.1 hypothetical protein [Gammaproteobacteria bacterium]MDH5310380.1 hypothetical protein [Gammaproteobacteria bacterium]